MDIMNHGWEAGYTWLIGILILVIISGLVAIILNQKRNHNRLTRNSTKNMLKARYDFLSHTY